MLSMLGIYSGASGGASLLVSGLTRKVFGHIEAETTPIKVMDMSLTSASRTSKVALHVHKFRVCIS